MMMVLAKLQISLALLTVRSELKCNYSIVNMLMERKKDRV